MVSVSPVVPKSTSWCASSPAARTECTRIPSTSAPRAPSTSSLVASGDSPSPASLRAFAIRAAVCNAVPLGEPHHQHGTAREVGRDDHADVGLAGQPGAYPLQPGLGEPAGPDHHG